MPTRVQRPKTNTARTAKWRAKRRAAGLCIRCGSPSPDTQLCGGCTAKQVRANGSRPGKGAGRPKKDAEVAGP